jgi:hypothetical protein
LSYFGRTVHLSRKQIAEQSIESKFADQIYLMAFCIFPAHFISRKIGLTDLRKMLLSLLPILPARISRISFLARSNIL